MTKPSLSISLLLCLLSLAGCTRDREPQTPPVTEPRHYCPLTPCELPERPALVTNDDWRRAVDELEAALLACAVQVMECRERQEAVRPSQ